MAYDAMEVSQGISDLLEKTARDIEILSLLPKNTESYLRFYSAQASDFTKFVGKDELPVQVPLNFFNRVLFMNLKGDFVIHILKGKVERSIQNIKECHQADLCDEKLLRRMLQAKRSQLEYGRVLRHYFSKKTPEADDNASIHVAYRVSDGVLVLGLDYIHFRDHLIVPTFPYAQKRDLLQSYYDGNYIYITDSEHNVIAHPKYWNSVGVDRKTGEFVPTMQNDNDEGTRPINIAKYQSGKLKEYFERLLTRSFVQKAIDIFQAPNLTGTNRVLSVAPIFLSKGQFKETGVFGHVVIGCSVEYFEVPKEHLVPYY